MPSTAALTRLNRLPVRRYLAEAANKGNLAQGRELGLDVARGLAILLAMGRHLNQVDAGPVANALLRPGAKIGWAGVDLFFVLSGFLIGGMVLKEAKLTGRFNYGRFLLRRILRLWPTLYTFLFAMLLFGFPARDFFWQISLHVQGYVPTKSATHLWSLAVEEQFYLLLAVGFSFLSRTCGWRRTLPWLLVGLIIICPILRALAPSFGYSAWDIYVLTHFRIDTLAAGVLLAFLASERPKVFERLLRKRAIWAGVAACGVVFMWHVWKNSPLGEVAGYSVSWVSSAATILVLYRARVPASLCWLCSTVAFIGQISYPMYLWHVAIFKLERTYLPKLIGDGREALQTVLIYFSVIAVAFTVTVLIERPVMRLRDRILPAPRRMTV